MSRRFTNPKPTKSGRIGHPVNTSPTTYDGKSKMIPCAGVVFGDQALNCKWTYRIYAPAHGHPQLEVLLQSKMEARRINGYQSWSPNTVVDIDFAPQEVVEFALAEIVRFRLRGRLPAV